MAKDPVCGMKVSEKKAEHKSKHKGRTYYFCSYGCLKNFEHNTETFVK